MIWKIITVIGLTFVLISLFIFLLKRDSLSDAPDPNWSQYVAFCKSKGYDTAFMVQSGEVVCGYNFNPSV